jgi:hypothetical protein
MQRAKQHGLFHLGAHLNSSSISAAGLSSASTHRCLQDIRQICYFFPYHQFFAWLAKMHGDAAEETGSSAISATGAGDLAASHDIVAVTGRGGFLSAAVAPVAGDHQRRVRRVKIIGPTGSATPTPHGEERVFAASRTMSRSASSFETRRRRRSSG